MLFFSFLSLKVVCCLVPRHADSAVRSASSSLVLRGKGSHPAKVLHSCSSPLPSPPRHFPHPSEECVDLGVVVVVVVPGARGQCTLRAGVESGNTFVIVVKKCDRSPEQEEERKEKKKKGEKKFARVDMIMKVGCGNQDGQSFG